MPNITAVNSLDRSLLVQAQAHLSRGSEQEALRLLEQTGCQADLAAHILQRLREDANFADNFLALELKRRLPDHPQQAAERLQQFTGIRHLLACRLIGEIVSQGDFSLEGIKAITLRLRPEARSDQQAPPQAASTDVDAQLLALLSCHQTPAAIRFLQQHCGLSATEAETYLHAFRETLRR